MAMIRHFFSRHSGIVYVAAIALVGAAGALSFALKPWIERTPSPFFTAAVVAAAWIGGLRPALVAALAAAFFRHFLFFADSPFTSEDLLTSLVFLVVGGFIGLLFEKLNARQEWLDVTLRSIGDAAIATDAQGRVVFLNPVAEKWTGWKASEAMGKPLSDVFKIVNEITRGPVVNPVDKALREGTIVALANHTLLITKNGEEMPIEDTASPIRNIKGQIIGAILVFQNVTDRRRAENAVLKAQEQMKNYAAELEREVAARTADLRHALKEMEGFCYSMAHDLKAPLRSMRGFAEMLSHEYAHALDKNGLDYARRIQMSAGKMNQLVNDLLQFGWLTHAEVPLGPVCSKELTTHALKSLAQEITATHARIHMDNPLPRVLANPTVLTQVLTNLISNAIKFVPPGTAPDLTIRAEHHSASARIWVEDNGIGIAPEFQEKIFGTFQRLHSADAYPGTGIGLAIVRKGLERMNGRVGVVSEPGKGSRFWFELPLA